MDLTDDEMTAADASLAQLEPQEPMLQFFRFSHLPPHLKPVSARFGQLAVALITDLPRNAERTVALRKLLEGKDAAVRARLFKPTEKP
jgi:hypothetical protein